MTRNQNIRMGDMLMEKPLDDHPDKTVCIVTGSLTYKKKVKKELKDSPLMFRSFTMEEKESKKYLGHIIHSGELERSSLATVQERMGRIKGVTHKIKLIIKDFPCKP